VVTDDVDVTACPEAVRLGPMEDDRNLDVLVRPVDVAEAETEAVRSVRVAGDRSQHVAADAHLAAMAGELARFQRRRGAARDRVVDEEDRERGCHRERNHEPHRVPTPLHGNESSAGGLHFPPTTLYLFVTRGAFSFFAGSALRRQQLLRATWPVRTAGSFGSSAPASTRSILRRRCMEGRAESHLRTADGV